jgi:hypothetical protein
MGFFDLANPLLDLIDSCLAVFSDATGRLVFWAILGSFVSMFLYRLTSRQEELAALKPQMKQAQKALATFDGELEEILPLVWRSLRLSLRQLGLALGPAVLASFPMIFLLLWISNRYDLVPPNPGATITVSIEAADSSELLWLPDAGAKHIEQDLWQVTWPNAGEVLQLMVQGNTRVLELPTNELSPVVHKQQWWNALLGNPAGYLDDDQPVEAVFMELPTQTYLPFGPSWVRGWEFLFIGLLFSFSIAIKLIFKIH